MRPAIIVVVVVGLAAAAGTGVMLNSYMGAAEQQAASAPVEAPKPVTLGVLVASGPLEVGKTLDAASFAWEQWPEAAAVAARERGAAVADAAGQAEGQKRFEGAITRIALLKGELFTEEKVARPAGGSVLSVVLTPGYRSMALAVNAIIGAGGMVQPGDKVDVMLTTTLNDIGAGTVDAQGRWRPRLATETILSDVRVLSADRRLTANPAPDVPVPANVSVEVTPEQAELLATASQMGTFTLTMRPLAVSAPVDRSGLPFATDVAVMPNLRAARLGTSAEKLNPRDNPFARAPVPPPAPVAVAAPPPAAQQQGITVYRWTAPTVLPVENGRVLQPGQGAPGTGLPAGSVAPAAPAQPPPVETAPRPAAPAVGVPASPDNQGPAAAPGSPAAAPAAAAAPELTPDEIDELVGGRGTGAITPRGFR